MAYQDKLIFQHTIQVKTRPETKWDKAIREALTQLRNN